MSPREISHCSPRTPPPPTSQGIHDVWGVVVGVALPDPLGNGASVGWTLPFAGLRYAAKKGYIGSYCDRPLSVVCVSRRVFHTPHLSPLCGFRALSTRFDPAPFQQLLFVVCTIFSIFYLFCILCRDGGRSPRAPQDVCVQLRAHLHVVGQADGHLQGARVSAHI